MATFSLSSLPLEGDGMVENLFHYLWCKDELDAGPVINIPDTVIFKFRQPAYWYFTSKSGEIKKKSRYNLTNIRIEEAFTRKSIGSDIIAYYLSTNPDTGVTTIEYFDRATFREFLYNREKVNNGVLQKFIEPKGTKNVMIRGIWSPKILLLERRENLRHLTDSKYSLYERAVTYEGAEHHSKACPVRGSILPVSVQDVCKQVVQHVSEVSFRKFNISRMAVNFKVDGEGRIWLLWCTSLRLEQTVATRLGSGCQSIDGGPSLDFQSSFGSLPSQLRQTIPSKQGPISLFAHCEVPESVKKSFEASRVPRSANQQLTDEEMQALLQSQDAANGSGPGSSGKMGLSPGAVGTGGGHGLDSDEARLRTTGCRSCGETSLLDRFYRVPYKIVVAHFEQFMAVLSASNGGSMQVEWPPHPKVIAALGKVGLAPLEKLRETIRNAKDKSKVVVAAEDIEIPPVLRDTHPNLSAEDYRRFRRDPMFLFKTSAVCEDCYLVYAQVSSLGGENPGAVPSSIATKNVAAQHRIKKKHHRAMHDHIERTTRQRRQQHAKVRMERERKHLAQHGGSIVASATPIRLDKFREPELPPRIDESNIGTLSITRSQPVLQSQLDFENGDAAQEEAKVDLHQLPEDFRQELQERENAFFRDLYKNPNLQNGHPLSHMISSQAKLWIAKKGVSSDLRPPKADRKLGKAGPPVRNTSLHLRALSPREIEAIDWSSPYAKSQVVSLPSKPKTPGAGQGGRRRAGSGNAASGEDSDRGRPDTTESMSAQEHRDFLLKTMERVQSQLDNPMPLDQAVGLQQAADVAAHDIDEGKAMDRAWEMREKALAATPTDLGRILRTAIQVGGERLMAAVDLQGQDFVLTVFNPRLALSQKLEVPLSVVIENAPPGTETSAELARYVLDSLEEDTLSPLVPEATCVKLPFKQ
ncbi:Small glutamine-rich tetratricopeptide repeat-containing protein beta [Durusdinium trenchii]|uniref:Small glutamine-rich tetratricopeptide repeat-containing protein beta n=1 Tax=Durusdinium trenchii TaxID=1381693 RepID=A0ABP0QAS2_9DINO